MIGMQPSVADSSKGGNIFCTQKIMSNNNNLKIAGDPNKENEDEGTPKNEMEDEEEESEKPALCEDIEKDERMKNFVVNMTECDKDLLCCDEIFALYLRHISKQVNEHYYRIVLRFVLLYRECLNEYGWLKRRDHYQKAYTGDSTKADEHDELLTKLRKDEEREEQLENERIAAILAKKSGKKVVKIVVEQPIVAQEEMKNDENNDEKMIDDKSLEEEIFIP